MKGYLVKKQSGFAHIIVPVALVLVLIGALGFTYWKNFVSKDTSSTPSTTQSKNEDNANISGNSSVGKATIPTGWTIKNVDDKSFSYALPSGEKLEYSIMKSSDAVHVGYGAPVYLKYTVTEGWQTYDTDSSSEPTIKRSDNLVKNLEVKADGEYPASYYETGNAMTGETRILVVVGTNVYQFVFPQKLQTVEFNSQFVKTLTFYLVSY